MHNLEWPVGDLLTGGIDLFVLLTSDCFGSLVSEPGPWPQFPT